MKKTIVSIFQITLIFLLLSCSAPVPEEVKSAFNSTYPNAADVEWEMEDDNEWEVEFELDDEEFTACYTAAGEWLETEQEIHIDSIPDDILETLYLELEGFIITEAERVKTPEFVGYEIEIKMDAPGGPQKMMEVTIDDKNKLISVEDEEDEDEDDD